MVTQAPKRSAVLTALAFALSCIGLIIFVWTQFGGTVPLAPQGYRIHALFRESGLLVPNADVRISGVTVGRVQAVQARGINSYVTIEIRPQYAPIPVDTRAVLRQKTLLGEAYVELSAGNGAGRKFADGGTIPATHVQPTQALDQVLGSFDRPTQRDLQALLSGTATALAGRGQTLNDAIGNLDPTMRNLGAMIGALNQQRGDVGRLISSSATVLSTLGNRSSDLRSLVTAGDAVLATTAAGNRQLTATVDALPPFLVQLRTTLRTLDTTLAFARPTLRELRPAAPLITPTLREVITLSGPATKLLHEAPALLGDAGRALPAITRFTTAFRPAVDALVPAARQVVPLINFVAIYRRELVAAMANLAADLQATAPAAVPGGSTNYLRAISSLGSDSVYGQTTRDPTVRSNTYFSPGELDNLAQGLFTSSCSNTGNQRQVPLSFGNVPCRVQPGVRWGHGVGPGYYPRLTRAPKPLRR